MVKKTVPVTKTCQWKIKKQVNTTKLKKNKTYSKPEGIIANPIIKITISVEIESQPWSKISPRGDPTPNLRACFPSIASNVWYINKLKLNQIKLKFEIYK